MKQKQSGVAFMGLGLVSLMGLWGSPLAAAVTVPNVQGTYTGSVTHTLANCTAPTDNRTVSAPGTMTITSQSGTTFGGTFTITSPGPGEPVTDTSTLTGTVGAEGEVRGEGTYRVTIESTGTETRQGTLTFAGVLAENAWTVTHAVVDTTGGCTGRVAVAVTRGGAPGSPHVGLDPHDFNGDGQADLVWWNTVTGEVRVWLMADRTVDRIVAFPAVSPALTLVGVGDVTGDFKADLLWHNATTGQVEVGGTVASTDGLSMSPPAYLGLLPPPFGLAGVGDVDGNGQVDLVWRTSPTGHVGVWQMAGGGVLVNEIISGPVPPGWVIKEVGDLNGDGHSDLVWRDDTERLAGWLGGPRRLRGVLTTPAGFKATRPLAWKLRGIGDLDGDGKADLVWRHSDTGELGWWKMDGRTRLLEGPIIHASAPAQALTLSPDWVLGGLGDVNGDGKADLWWHNHHPANQQIAVWLMDGPVRMEEAVSTDPTDPESPLTLSTDWVLR